MSNNDRPDGLWWQRARDKPSSRPSRPPLWHVRHYHDAWYCGKPIIEDYHYQMSQQPVGDKCQGCLKALRKQQMKYIQSELERLVEI